MSKRLMWKMLHLLYTLKPGQRGLTPYELLDVGIHCGTDTIDPLKHGGAISYDGNVYSLTEPAKAILTTCVVANQRWSSDDLWVDYPSAFVIMPFSEPWSDTVFQQIIKPGIVDAGLQCTRGDTILRIGDLTQDIWGALLHAGIVVADVSVLNANVFYELGLTHALGKDTIILKQAGSKVPADIGGTHYHEYDLQALEQSKMWLCSELAQWATDNNSQTVKKIYGR